MVKEEYTTPRQPAIPDHETLKMQEDIDGTPRYTVLYHPFQNVPIESMAEMRTFPEPESNA